MLYFNSDYMAGGHPAVMRLLNDTNLLHTPGYGEDSFTREAARMILNECGIPEGEVFFAVGGTQANAVVADRLLDRNDGVIAADTAHISTHEAGAIELNGHKVIELTGKNGKLQAIDIDRYAAAFYADDTNPHMVRPRMVYISFPTELGTIYSSAELKDIYSVCQKRDMLLYIDGARLAYGLAARGNDLTIKDIAASCDAFYIGGTKCGALFGEAIVTRRPELFRRFFSLMKMHGAVLAKGRLLGIQFKALFEDGLYYQIGKEAVELAEKLKDGFAAHGYQLYLDSPTNQQFVALPNEVIDSLKADVSFELWGPRGESESIVRFVTSWSTTDEDINSLLAMLPDNPTSR